MSDFYEICTDLGVPLAKKKGLALQICLSLEHLLRLINLKKKRLLRSFRVSLHVSFFKVSVADHCNQNQGRFKAVARVNRSH